MLRPKLPTINEPTEYPPMEYDLLSADVKDAPFQQTAFTLARWVRTVAIGTAIACLGMIAVTLIDNASLSQVQKISTKILLNILLLAINATMICINIVIVFKAFRYSNELRRAMRLNTRLEDLETPFKTAIVMQKLGFTCAISMVVNCAIIVLARFL